jgi:hypothetical protein
MTDTLCMFPLSRRLGKVNHVAFQLAGKPGSMGEAYWHRVVSGLDRSMRKLGIVETERLRQLSDFRGAVAWALPRARIDNTMVKALARAHRWKKLLDSGRFQTVQDLAEAEKINPSYIARVLRLTLLAPDIVEAILDGRQPPGLQLDDLLAPFPVEWARQREALVDGIGAERQSRKEREPAD